MKISYVWFVVIMFTTNVFSQITIDDSLTIQEIVEDVLISSPCAELSNFISSTGIDFQNNPNGIGVFDANDSNFTFDSGVILSTGDIFNSPGPNVPGGSLSDGTGLWLGDLDLEANTNAMQTNNASFIQFDFVPSINTISFNFLMASEEYNQIFECNFSDAFAFILIDQVTGVSQNLAVLPETNTPIEVTNIHPTVPSFPEQGIVGCPGINPMFFDKYNFEPFNNPTEAAIAFNGQTVPLKAMGDVIIGNAYTIKIVVADDRDTLFDTAIFLEANSFSLGIDLGDDLTIANGNALCDGSGSIEIGVEDATANMANYQWSVFNQNTMLFEDIVGETNEILLVDTSGIYQIEVVFSGGCSILDQITVEFVPEVFATRPSDFIVCDTTTNDGITTLNFIDENLISEILNGQDPNVFIVTFYDNQNAAENGTNPLAVNGYENTTNPQIIFARVTAGTTNCFAITDFTIEVKDAPLITLPDFYRLCLDVNNQVIPAVEGEPSPPTIETGLNALENTFEWFLNDQLLLNENNSSLSITQAGEYSVHITNIETQCFNEYTTTVFSSSPPTNVSARVISDAFSSNNIIEVTAEESNSIIYSLDDGPFQESNVFEDVAGGNHSIIVKDTNGCGITSISIFVISYNRFFTPNNDGFNDTWNLDGLYELDANAVIILFTRFGKRITQISQSSDDWDGTYNGRPLFSDDYWFKAIYMENQESKVFRGHVTLKR